MSRKVEIDYKVLDALLQFKVTLIYCADYMKVSQDAIRRRIKEDYDMTFGEYHALKMQDTARKLQQKAIEIALTGKNTSILIFALKNLAHWSDKIEQTQNTGDPIQIQIIEDNEKD
jgi:hypothetical protein